MLFGSSSIERRMTQDEQPRWPMHNVLENNIATALEDGRARILSPSELEAGSTAIGTPEEVEENEPSDGTWAERDVGGPLNQNLAMADYEALRQDLTALSKTRSARSTRSPQGRGNLVRTLSRRSGHGPQRVNTSRSDTTGAGPGAEAAAADDDEDDFELADFMREGRFEARHKDRAAKKVGVVYRDLTVKGAGSSSTFVKTLPDAVLGTFGPDLYALLCRLLPFLAFRRKNNLKTLIHSFSGLVRDGEMMLVLGKPGSGCTTFLKAIANKREEFAEVSGQVLYGGIDAETQSKHFRGEVNYNPEDDVHFPELSVYQTFLFALLTKTKKRHKDDIPVIINALLKMFGIPHTAQTKVGNAYVRGVSGGERKRVSIAETLATKSTVLCWDNSTRGLDASTALDYAKSLRIMTDVSNKTTLVTLYQAGEGIYDLMDKVLVIDGGRCIYQGPAKEAKQYFIDLGFEAAERSTTADFLAACTDVKQRRFRKGHEDSTPKTPAELEAAFHKSDNYRRVLADVEQYEDDIRRSNYADAEEFKQTVREGKSNKTVRQNSSYTISFPRQILACAQRELWLIWGDKTTLYTKYFIIIANGFIVGSLFYNEPLSTAGAFSRGGAIFFSILFLGWLQLAELMKAVSGREVVARQHDYAFYHPFAVTIARVVVDILVLLPQVCIFGVIMYFMCNLDLEVSKFWIYLLFIYVTTITITALYRMFAALSPTIDDAVRFSGIALNLLVIFTGYVIPKPQLTGLVPWFGWLYYVNPLSYAFEAVLTNEFSGRTMDCAAAQLVPSGPGAIATNQGCVITGAAVNARTVPGSAYLATTYTYTRAHLWRNFGVLIAWAVLYILVTVFAVEVFNFAVSGGGVLVFKRSRKAKQAVKENSTDEKKAGAVSEVTTSSDTEADETKQEDVMEQIAESQSVFTWQDVCYTVPYQGGERQLLNHVNGYAKPGLLIALMGASGAGKTTLLNTLAQRQNMGVVTGDMLVDGRKLGVEFQRGTGFCEQMDLHDGTATIREALEFSAVLRQDRNIPREEKIMYVDKILELLELNEMEDAIISCLGVEQRKRVTIGVELAAKPSLLLFLDEPTSGLDSQSAASIVRFLKKLARAGQAIICTIHQPSSELIQHFDMILALNPGGNTFYFGPVGDNGSSVIEYFKQRGFECPSNKNVAEFILEVAAKSRRRPDGTKVDWNEEWRKSDNAATLLKTIEGLKTERGKEPEPAVGAQHEFAAPVWTQTTMLIQRVFRQHWRDPSYYYGKLFVALIVGIFNGFTFYMLGNNTQDLQDRLFSAFLILTIPPTVVNSVLPKFFQNMMLWQARELPSRIYGWFAFTTAQVVAEIPISVVSSVIYFLTWYFPSGLPTETSVSGYVFLMTLLFFLFMSSWGQWIAAFAPSFTVIANVLPFFFVMFGLFNGVVVSYAQLNVFWKYWMYYVNPSQWWISGVLAKTLHGIPVMCSPDETAQFTPPAGSTCAEYAGAFAASAGGYFLDASSTTLCQYCPYSVGDQYLNGLNIKASDAWRDFGIFLAFVVSNYALVYFFIWSVRIKGWSFGFGYVFAGLGKLVGYISKPFNRQKEQSS